MRRYYSVVDDDVLEHIPEWKGRRAQGATLLTYLLNQGTIEAAIACASLFWPEIVEDDGLVFLALYYRQDQVPKLRTRFADDKRQIERWLNAHSLREFFMFQQFKGDPAGADEELVSAFGQAMQHFWSLRLKTLFPTRTFIVELGDEIEGENGPTITFYEAPSTDVM